MRLFNFKDVSPVGGISDFIQQWKQPTPYRWQILGVAVALTFTMITLLVPKTELTPEKDKDIAPEIVDNARIAIEPDVPDTRKIWVKVGRRDTLTSIAQRNRVTVAQIKSWNNLKHDKVAAGTSLQLHVPYKAPAARRVTRTAARKAAPPHRIAAKPAPRNTRMAVKPARKKRS